MLPLILIPLIPLLMAVFNRLMAGRLSKSMAGSLASGSVGLSFLLAVAAFFQLSGLPVESRTVVQEVFSWVRIGTVNLPYSLLLDPLSAAMICVVTGVGFLIHVYSTAYMHDEPEGEFGRYFAYLNFFVFSMLTLVLSANFLVLFVGWELVGLSSYLLIGFFRTKASAADAGKKAFIVNRVGDLGFVIGILLLLGLFGTADFQAILPAAASKIPAGSSLATVIALSLFLGAMGKSAQVPLHVWLPDAMEGPTPVSALIHAATMVTAGVFMVARCHVLFELSPTAMATVAWVGAVTAIFAASIGLVQNDIKRVMAYSTLSQLGYMVMAVGVGAYAAGFYHLFTHAFFKALLFLGCGSVMHALGGELDLTKMGGLKDKIPATYKTFLIGALCLVGFPLTSGFFSKDEILDQALNSAHGSWGLWLVGTVTVAMTVVYVFRLVFKVFFGATRLDHHAWDHAHESPAAMTTPLWILAILSLAAGLLGLPEAATHFQPFKGWLEPVFKDVALAPSRELVSPWLLMILNTGLVLAGIGFCYNVFAKPSEFSARVYASPTGRALHTLLWNKYYVDELYQLVFVSGLLGLGRLVWRFFDQGVLDGLVNLSAGIARGAGNTLRSLQTGYIRYYAGAFAIGVILMLAMALHLL
jgi:NADH-quinone oxidoreductase subunit L